MAGRIAGITIEIGGDTTKLSKALKSVDAQLKTTQSNLKDIDKLLKLNPGNVDLLAQKQKNLESAISLTKQRLEELKKAQANFSEGSQEWDALQREIIATEGSLADLEKTYADFTAEMSAGTEQATSKVRSLKTVLIEAGEAASSKLKAAGEKMQAFGSKVEEAGKKMKPLSTAAAALGGALLKLGYDAVTGADDLNTLSKQTGISTDELQKFQYASALIDVSIEDMTGALKKLKPKITEDNKALAELGVSTTNADGSMRGATDVFFDAVEALSKIDNETERDQKAMELFGKSADSLAGIIDDGGKALKELGKEAEDLGIILDGDTLDALNETNDTIDKMKGLVKGSLGQLGATIAKVVAPAVEKLSKKIGEWTDKLKKLTPKQAETILKIAGAVAAIAPALIAIGKIVKGVGSVISILGSVIGVLGGPLTVAIAAAIAAGVLLYKNWDTIKAFAISMKEGVANAWNEMKTRVVNSANNLKSAVVTAWNTVKTSVTTATDSLKTSVVNSFNNLKTAVVNAWNAVKTSVVNTANSVKSSVSTAWESMKSSVVGSVSNLKDAVVSGWNNLKSAVTSAAYSVKDAVVGAWNNLKNSAISTVSGMVSSIKSLFSFDFHLPELKLPSWSDIHARLSTIISNIKSLFNFDWSLPHIKVPHFSVQGGKAPYGLGGQGYLPSINVSWYRRAYDNPMLFTAPTVMATPTGYKGFGDGHGAEIVLGLNKLQELVGGAGDVVINVYAQPGMDVNQLADAIQARFVAQNKQRRLAHA